MMLFVDNVRHQITVAGMALLAEARSGSVDVTGWRLLEEPQVSIAKTGAITLKIAVPEVPIVEAVEPPVVENEEDTAD